MNNIVSQIIEYEGGMMDEEDVVPFFQSLITSGMAWELQGRYGRMARDLIDAGLCHLPPTHLQDDDSDCGD